MSLPPFQTLLDRHAAEVHRLLLALVGASDADDAFQETFLSALEAYDGLPAEADLGAWIATIAVRKGIDVHRRRSRHAVPVADPPAGRTGALGPSDIAALEPSDIAALEPSDGVLWEEVRRLPTKQRIAVAGRFGADLSYDHLAGLLECSPVAARRNVHEGITKLRARLAGG